MTKRASDFPAPMTHGTTFLADLVATRKVIVVCGAGGVGKTTTSAAIGLAGALAGRKTLVLTIDPARRLAEAMGIPAASREPARLDPSRLPEGIGHAKGELWAWMLDPEVVFEGMVRRLSESDEKAEEILGSRLYGHVSRLVAGMQEYTAAEALHSLASSGNYDLVVLDTPPSRNALDFLDAPKKLSGFLDERVVSLFLPTSFGLMRAASSLVSTVFTRIFGAGFFDELKVFIGAFSTMFGAMRGHAGEVAELLTSRDASFLLVTSPEPSALAEAGFFQAKMRELGVPLAGSILNRSYAYTRGLVRPEGVLVPEGASPALASALGKLGALADLELQRAERDRRILSDLVASAGGGFAVATPHLGGAVEDVAGLVALADHLVGRED
ncbi:MAG: ArsA-related P-loop ATPase [Polyangiaceae bacterium]